RRIRDLLAQLRAALVAREHERIERRVAEQMGSLARGLSDAAPAGNGAARSAKPAPETSKLKRSRRAWSPAARKAAAARMKKYWAARRGKGGAKPAARGTVGKAKPATLGKSKPAGGNVAKAGPMKVSPGRARQIAAMKAYWAKRKAEKV